MILQENKHYFCTKEKDIETLKIELAVAQSDIQKVIEEISGIKKSLDKFHWWFLGIISSTLITFIVLYLQGR